MVNPKFPDLRQLFLDHVLVSAIFFAFAAAFVAAFLGWLFGATGASLATVVVTATFATAAAAPTLLLNWIKLRSEIRGAVTVIPPEEFNANKTAFICLINVGKGPIILTRVNRTWLWTNAEKPRLFQTMCLTKANGLSYLGDWKTLFMPLKEGTEIELNSHNWHADPEHKKGWDDKQINLCLWVRFEWENIDGLEKMEGSILLTSSRRYGRPELHLAPLMEGEGEYHYLRPRKPSPCCLMAAMKAP